MPVSILDLVFVLVLVLFFIIGACCGLIRLIHVVTSLGLAGAAAYFGSLPLMGLLKSKGVINSNLSKTNEILIQVGIALGIFIIVFLLTFFIFKAMKNVVRNNKGLKVVDGIFGAVFYTAIGLAVAVGVAAILNLVASKNDAFNQWFVEDTSKQFGFTRWLLEVPQQLKNLFVNVAGGASSSTTTGAGSTNGSSTLGVDARIFKLLVNSIAF